MTQTLNELEASNFIRKYPQYEKKSRDTLYQLLDNYTLFYFKFIKNNSGRNAHFWLNLLHTPNYYSWAGNAFEMVCIQHIEAIKKSLGISGVQTEVYSWQDENAQIDLMIDRKDQIINLFEAKFSIAEFEINKSYAMQLRRKIASFMNATNTKKSVWLTFITTYGLKKNKYAGQVQQVFKLEDLFR